MIKVLIVDDEYLQRELIKASVCWEEIDAREILEAEDGKEALELFEYHRPDIVIMDINIPYFNGIEVSKRMKKHVPETQILIVTAYGEFSYAKEAVEFGAMAFILKPLNPEELRKKLEQAKELLETKRMESENKKEFELQRRNMKKEKLLLECLSGLIKEKGREGRWQECGLPSNQNICILDIKFINLEEQKQHKEELEEYIEEQFPNSESVLLDKDLLIFLFSDTTSEEFLVKLRMLTETMQEELAARELAVGAASGIHAEPIELAAAYREAYGLMGKAMEECRFYIYERQSLKLFMEQISYQSDEFRYYLRGKEYEKLYGLVHTCFTDMEQDDYDNQKALYVATDILINFASYLMGMGVDISDELENGHEILRTLSYQGNVNEIAGFIQKVLDKNLGLIQGKVTYSTQKRTEEARKFIQENYYVAELSLNMAAEAIGINASYLSNIFKKEYGYALSHYIIQVRMEKAADYMIENQAATLQEIAEEVGYMDVYYFSKSFKNYYGVSPSKFSSKDRYQKK